MQSGDADAYRPGNDVPRGQDVCSRLHHALIILTLRLHLHLWWAGFDACAGSGFADPQRASRYA